MLQKLKDTISDLAYAAVSHVENVLSTSSGQEKKRAAIAFIVGKLTIASPFKPLIILFMTDFIDNAIEKAVSYMNEVRNED